VDVTRREFVKLGALASVSGLLASYLPAALRQTSELRSPEELIPASERWATAACTLCPGRCGAVARVVGGSIRKLEGNPLHPINEGTYCLKGHAALQLLYHPDRLTKPVMRKNRTAPWQVVSWEQALARLGTELRAIRSSDPTGLVLGLGALSAHEDRLLRRFAKAYGTPNVLDEGAFETGAEMVAAGQTYGGAVGYDLENSSYVLSFGELLEGWSPFLLRIRQFGKFRGRDEHGRGRGRLVQVGSRRSVSATKADEWIAVPPGMEGILALGIAHVLVRAGRHDRSGLAKIEGFLASKEQPGFEALLEDFGPAAVAGLTGLRERDIERLAMAFADAERPLAIGAPSFPHTTNGTLTQIAVSALNILLGRYTKQGGIRLSSEAQVTAWPPFEADETARRGLKSPPQAARGGWAALDGTTAPRAMILCNSNPLYLVPDAAGLRSTIEKTPFVVSLATVLDDTADVADLVLPLSTFLESWSDSSSTVELGYPVKSISAPVVAPFYESRPAGETVLALARSVGGTVAAAFPWKDCEQVLRHDAKALQARRSGSIVDADPERFFERLLEAGGWWDVDDKADTRPPRLPTADQLRRLVGEGAEKPSRELFEPTFVGDPLAYPFRLAFFRTATSLLGREAAMPWLLEIFGVQHRKRWEPWIEIPRAAALDRGIANGDKVIVESPDGARVELVGVLVDGVSEEAVHIPIGFGSRPGKGRASGPWASDLGDRTLALSPGLRDPASGQACLSTTRVNIYQAKG